MRRPYNMLWRDSNEMIVHRLAKASVGRAVVVSHERPRVRVGHCRIGCRSAGAVDVPAPGQVAYLMIVEPLHPRGDNRATAIIFAELGCNDEVGSGK